GVKVAFLADEPPAAPATSAGSGTPGTPGTPGAPGTRATPGTPANPSAAPPAAAAVRIPRAALRPDHGQTVVYVLRGDRRDRRAARVDPAPGDEATVVSGLSAGDQVVVEGPPDLADGRQVVVVR